MTVSHTAQLLEFAYALVLGFMLGALYAAARAVRTLRALTDTVFVLAALAACVAFFLTVGGGLARGYALAGIFLGMAGMIALSRRIVGKRQGSGKKKEKKWTEAEREKKSAGLLFF